MARMPWRVTRARQRAGRPGQHDDHRRRSPAARHSVRRTRCAAARRPGPPACEELAQQVGDQRDHVGELLGVGRDAADDPARGELVVEGEIVLGGGGERVARAAPAPRRRRPAPSARRRTQLAPQIGDAQRRTAPADQRRPAPPASPVCAMQSDAAAPIRIGTPRRRPAAAIRIVGQRSRHGAPLRPEVGRASAAPGRGRGRLRS